MNPYHGTGQVPAGFQPATQAVVTQALEVVWPAFRAKIREEMRRELIITAVVLGVVVIGSNIVMQRGR